MSKQQRRSDQLQKVASCTHACRRERSGVDAVSYSIEELYQRAECNIETE
jgi:hypothetical protein